MKIDDLRLEVSTEDFGQDELILRRNLRKYLLSNVKDYQLEHFFLSYKTPEGDLVAGLLGYQNLGRFTIDKLWVGDKYRYKGLGSKLLQKIEKISKDAGDLYVRVNTTSFEALDFYKKNGYEVFG